MKTAKSNSRKDFIKKSIALGILPLVKPGSINFPNLSNGIDGPFTISTWSHGMAANDKAMELLVDGKSALDAAEAGVRVSESDPSVTSVGYGGLPDQDGNVTLDACIMDWNGNCGAVSYLQQIKNPISVARKVMEETDHVMLSGDGALKFALEKGFQSENLLTEEALDRWVTWKKSTMPKAPAKSKVDPNPKMPPPLPLNSPENHDTIGLIAMDKNGKLAGACTTSGLAWKLHGRVGDSPIIGAGLFVDGQVGAATATGKGESVIKIAGTHLIVELMRQGKTPQEACEEAIHRIVEKQKDYNSFQVGFIACNIQGEVGAFSLHKGFQYALHQGSKRELLDAAFFD
jgi:isoaspartyl peptidase/L-asparaginase-like protein (Ntn-hydrolase superfamily)